MEGNYSYFNIHYANSFLDIHGDIVGKPYHITMHPDDINVCAVASLKCFMNPDLLPATIRKHDGKGGYIVTQWEYKALFNEDDSPKGNSVLGTI